jgi:hypothetical protein
MVNQVVVALAICDVVCPFNMKSQGVVISKEADHALLLPLPVLPLESPCQPASTICTFTINTEQYKGLLISSDTVLQVDVLTPDTPTLGTGAAQRTRSNIKTTIF